MTGFGTGGAGKPFARIYWTTDGGQHWRGSNPTSGRTGAIDIVSRKVVWLFGRIAGFVASKAVIWRTTNGGRNWTTIHAVIAQR